MEWSAQQEAAIADVREWLKNKEDKLYYLAGYAGTGKTTLAKEIASTVKRVMYGAFTGKAASVMRKKGCTGASTIHSMIYSIEDEEGDQPKFVLNAMSDVRETDLVIIDECSMVNEEIGRDLMSFGKKILVIGDPAQLPPVSGAGFFTNGKPNMILTQIHRQALDNPIIEMSMRIREGGSLSFGKYGESRVVTPDEISSDDVIGADQVIVGLNRTRHLYNGRMRILLGHKTEMPVRGEKLICLKNDRHKKVFNGGMWSVENIKRDKKRPIYHFLLNSLDEEGHKRGVQVRHEFFNGTESDLQWEDKRGSQEFTFGYAITCHKSQGSQWNNVVLFNESAKFKEHARRWLYTAVTRAAEKIIVVQGG